jgi:hypothetical protein
LTTILIWQFANFVGVIIEVNRGKDKFLVIDLYFDMIFLVLKASGYFSIIAFLIIALVINCQIRSVTNQKEVKYEEPVMLA